MCGIAGVAGVQVKQEMLSAMAEAIRHRGPDEDGFFIGNQAGLAFRRLSIVDLESGQQPMSNEDGRLHLIFNGEIYDHHLLRNHLEKAGHRFLTDHSDTEVLVHGWEEWGLDLFPKLNGMIAVAIWDKVEQRLILGRDRYGIKPIYYAPLSNGGLVFASEIKSIHASGLVPVRPSFEGVREYFSFQNIWREQTMFDGVYLLDPGTVLIWQNGRITKTRYWDISFPRSRRGSLDELAAEHRDIVKRVVKRQIAADVPVMSYLSGGIDSTAITVAAFQVDPRVTAYSCIFDLANVGKDRFVDEREYSRLVAETYKLNRVELLLTQESLIESLSGYVRALEDLRMGMGYPVYLIAQRVAQDARVVLSGTGGDEFHAGYVGRYQSLGLNDQASPPTPLLKKYRKILRRWLGLDKRTPGVEYDSVDIEAAYRKILNFVIQSSQVQQVFTPEFLRLTNGFDPDDVMSQFIGQAPGQDWHDKVMYVDAKTYLAGLLTLEDKVSMAHSLETRVPLLDNELIDFVLDVPFSVLCSGNVGKILFRQSVKPWVPDVIYTKPKMGFGPPDASWYRGRLRPWIEEILSESRISSRGVFRPEYVKSILEDHFTGRREYTYLIWSLLNFEYWCNEFCLFV